MQSDPWLKAISCTLYWLLLLLIRCTLYREDLLAAAAVPSNPMQCSRHLCCNSASYLHNHRDTSPSYNYSSLPLVKGRKHAHILRFLHVAACFTCDAFQYRWCHPILLDAIVCNFAQLLNYNFLLCPHCYWAWAIADGKQIDVKLNIARKYIHFWCCRRNPEGLWWPQYTHTDRQQYFHVIHMGGNCSYTLAAASGTGGGGGGS